MTTAAIDDNDAEAAVARVPSLRHGVSLEHLFVGVFALAGWVAGLQALGDNSFLLHLRTGHLILDKGFPRHDPYSFTAPGVKWTVQSWLPEVLYGVLDDLFGGMGVRVLMAATLAALSAGMYLVARVHAGDRVRALGVASAAFLVVFAFWSERPLLLGLLAFLLVVAIVEAPTGRWGHALGPWCLPFVLWLWGNTHGSFALGGVFVGCWLLGRTVEGHPFWAGRERRVLIATGVGFVALLANPYGFDLLVFPLQLLGRNEVLENVKEWQRADFGTPLGWAFALWLVVLVIGLVRRRPAARAWFVVVPFVALGFWAQRNIGLAVIATLPFVAQSFAGAPRPDERSPIARLGAALLVVVAVVFGLTAASGPNYDLGRYPVAAFDAVEQQGHLGARTFTEDNWGGYVLARFWPHQQVFMDDRFDMYPIAVLDDYNLVANARPGWEKVFDRYDVDVVVWHPDDELGRALAADDGWEQTFTDDEASVFVRRTAD